jgi:uncharacterized protein YukJ
MKQRINRARRNVAVARYKMTVVFDVHEEVEMKYVYRCHVNQETAEMEPLPYEDLKGTNTQPHINKLYDDVIERIETSPKHPITYDIISFEELKAE